jgi:hypothetical protein
MAEVERRSSQREPLAVALQMRDGRAGVTRDVSPAGMYLFIPPGMRARGWYALEFTSRQARLRIRVLGEILRVKRGPLADGLAIRVCRLRVSPLQ